MEELIKISGVSKKFDLKTHEIRALVDINLTVRKGEIIMIMGPSGSGKSTLLHILGLMDSPTQGSVFVKEKEVTGMPSSERAGIRNKLIGFIFQFHYLLPEFNTIENIILPGLISGKTGKEALLERANRILSELGLDQRTKHFPSQLSGGEQQRAALARAVFNNPELILADEPTGNLDRDSSILVMELLRKLVKEKNMSLVIVTHNQDLIPFSDRLVTLKAGILS